MKKILLDIECLDQGLPPLSFTNKEVVEMIRQLSPQKKRVVLRKIKKVCKRQIAAQVEAQIKNKNRTKHLQQTLMKLLGFNASHCVFNNRVLEKRVEMARRYIINQIAFKKC